MRADRPAVLSVYLNIPVDLAEHRGLPTRARELIKAAASAPGSAGSEIRETDAESIVRAVDTHSSEWLGHTIAIFASGDLCLFEAIPLPGQLTDQGVASARPYTRPLLAAIQRNPAYRAALLDTRHAWVFNIDDEHIEAVAERTDPGVPSAGFAGWYGLEGYRIQQRIMTLSRQHYKDTISILERTANGQRRPLVLGGHENEIRQFLATLPLSVRDSVAGSFQVDLSTMTPGKVRELATPVVSAWEEASESDAVGKVMSEPNGAATTSLPSCLEAARTGAIGQLILADDLMVPGYACDDCGALGIGEGECDCPEPGGGRRDVPDVLDELANQTLDGGGQVTSVRNPPFTAAARLRFPVRTASGRNRWLP
jgi:peptide chain release factor subunit 1